MPQRDSSYLTDIINAAEQIEEFIADIDKRQFEESALVQSAVIRQIEVIGEATKRLSQTFTSEHPEIPWKNMAGMRDILIHAYDHVDIDELWNAASASIPALLKKIRAIIADEYGK
ncbi:MAG TPA: DUF86 domain-containing protein [Nitrospirae bacterium]|nr:hypothetical protein BMS3Bbin08_00401 [bacterium BMS3Bbin08]HDH33958.1 DUF86 domain-containing protein [Nitrospirota bacterium]HDH51690.1 DUF86 domain-containing protein [Nitrospirota bacterium]HDK17327.1 DUF86 domain-containing protein [Nitrospirota bacterium]